MAATVLLLGWASAAISATESSTSAFSPQVLCLNYRTDRFYVRDCPARCDYYAANAPTNPTVGLAISPTKSARWTHWGTRFAYGKVAIT